MKKVLLFIFFTLFLFVPISVFAEENNGSNYEPLVCKGSSDSNCSAFTYNSFVYDSKTLKYGMREGAFQGLPSSLSEMKDAHLHEVEVGPPSTYATYMTYFSTTMWDNIYYEYDFKKGIVYHFNYNFYAIGPFDENLKMSSYIPVEASGMYKDKKYSNDDSFYLFQSTRFNFSNEITDDWILATYPQYDTKVTITFRFAFNQDLDKFQFAFGKKNFTDKDLENKFAFLSLLKTNSTPLSDNMLYYNFSLSPSADVIHGGGGASIDKPSENDESIFSNMAKCETGDGILDIIGWLKFIGCHIGNLFTLLQNVFVRIGNFFLSILEFIIEFPGTLWEYFKLIISPKVFGLEALFTELNEFINKNDSGLTSIITSPLNFIKNLSDSQCVPFSLTLPYVNQTISFPCMTSIYNRWFGSMFSLYQNITTGIISYWTLVNLLGMINGFKDPTEDKVEVLDL